MIYDEQQNRLKLKALINIFSLDITTVAEVAGVSRSMLSKVLSGSRPGRNIWPTLEKKLEDLIKLRAQTYFQLTSVSIAEVVQAENELCGLNIFPHCRSRK